MGDYGQGRAQPPPRAGEGGVSLRGYISRDLSSNDQMNVYNKLCRSAQKLTPLGTGFLRQMKGLAHAAHSLANLGLGLPTRCATLAPLLVFSSKDEIDMRKRDRQDGSVEICRTVGQRPFGRLSHFQRGPTLFEA